MARKREFDEDAVLEKAMLLFLEKGFEASSIQDLTIATGISTSSMYQSFGDKRSIFLKSLARFCDLEQKQLAELAQASSSASQLIEQLFDAIELIAQNNDESYGSLAFNTMVEFGTRDADVTEIIFNHYFHIAEILAEVLTKAQASKSVTTKHDAHHLAHLILSTLHGVVTVKGAQPNYNYLQPIKRIILSLLNS